MKKYIVPILVIAIFIILILIIANKNKEINSNKNINTYTPISNSISGIINNPETDISNFVPKDIDGIKFDKIEKISSSEDQGFLQKGFIYFKVIGKEATTTTKDNQILLQTTPIILNIFVCNKENSSVCQDYLNNGVLEHNPGMSNKQILINNRNISYSEFPENNKSLDVNFEKTKMNSTSYIWCEGKYCMQMLSYSQFGDINDNLISAIIVNYQK